MAEKHLLYDFVHSFSEEEREYVRGQLTGRKKALFLHIATVRKRVSDAEIRDGFSHDTPKNFSKLKGQFMKAVASLLAEHLRGSGDAGRLDACMKEAEGYLAKQFYTEAIQALSAAKDMAMQMEEYAVAQKAVHLIQDAVLAKGRKEKDMQVEKVMAALDREISSLLREIEQARLLYFDTEAIKHTNMERRLQLAKEFQGKLPELSSARTLKSFLLLTRVHARMQFYLGDHDAAKQLMEAGMEAVKAKIHLAQQAEVSRFVVDGIGFVSRFWVYRADFGAAMEVFSNFKNIAIRANVGETKRLRFEMLYVKVQHAYQKGSVDQCKDALAQARSYTENEDGDILDLIALNITSAFICLKQHWFEKALVWAQWVQTAYDGSPLFENCLSAFYVELTAHTATRDWDILIAAIRRAEYHLDTRQRWSDYDRLLIAYFRRIAKRPEQLPAATMEFRERLSLQMPNPYVAWRHSFFDFVGLIEAAIASSI